MDAPGVVRADDKG